MSSGFRKLYVLSPPSFPQWDTDLAEQRRNVQVVFAGEIQLRQLVCVIDAASPNRLPQRWGGGTGRCHLRLRLLDAWLLCLHWPLLSRHPSSTTEKCRKTCLRKPVKRALAVAVALHSHRTLPNDFHSINYNVSIGL